MKTERESINEDHGTNLLESNCVRTSRAYRLNDSRCVPPGDSDSSGGYSAQGTRACGNVSLAHGKEIKEMAQVENVSICFRLKEQSTPVPSSQVAAKTLVRTWLIAKPWTLTRTSSAPVTGFKSSTTSRTSSSPGALKPIAFIDMMNIRVQ